MGITPHSLNHTAHYLSKLQPGQCLPRIEPPHPVLVFSTLNEARRNRLFHVVKRIGHWSSLTIPGQGNAVSYTHLRAHETDSYLVCRLLLEKKKKKKKHKQKRHP